VTLAATPKTKRAQVTPRYLPHPYRLKHNRWRYAQRLRRHTRRGKPVVITEFGCGAFKGAADRGPDGAFVFEFIEPYKRHSSNPCHDLDMSGYGIVKVLPGAPADLLQ
jgi:hypothetical protein